MGHGSLPAVTYLPSDQFPSLAARNSKSQARCYHCSVYGIHVVANFVAEIQLTSDSGQV